VLQLNPRIAEEQKKGGGGGMLTSPKNDDFGVKLRSKSVTLEWGFLIVSGNYAESTVQSYRFRLNLIMSPSFTKQQRMMPINRKQA
jgi:hypothetical protein